LVEASRREAHKSFSSCSPSEQGFDLYGALRSGSTAFKYKKQVASQSQVHGSLKDGLVDQSLLAT